MKAESILFTNARIVLPDSLIEVGWILTANGKITAIGEGQTPNMLHDGLLSCVQLIDLNGCLVMPGFIDLHTHGAGGADFMDGNTDAWSIVVRTHARHGTTALLATTLASGTDELENTLNIWKDWQHRESAIDLPVGAKIIGLHLEGPYFSKAQAGAQDPRYIRNPDPAEYQPIILGNPGIRIWSAAPELPGSLEFGRFAADHGILVSVAHSNAVFSEVSSAIHSGFSMVTHLYSGTSGVTRVDGLRRGGVIESALLLDELAVEVIADGSHLPPELLQLIFRCKGPNLIALVTDSMRAAGTCVTESILGSCRDGQPVIVRGGVARLPDGSALAGSIATADLLLRTMHLSAGNNICDIAKMMSTTPARLLRLHKSKGSLVPGYDADLAILDDNFNIVMTVIAGYPMFFEG